MDILENLGNAGLDGQPNLSFDLVDHPDLSELKSLGFPFKMQHRAVLAYGRKAVSNWQISALRTAVHIDGEGNLTWLHPIGRSVRFQKTVDGSVKAGDGSTVRVSADGSEIVITTHQPATWHYKDGFLESVQTRAQKYFFKTDRETILAIGKDGANRPLLEISYSDAGQLAGIILANGKKSLFQWTPDNCLQRVTGDAGPELAFEYDNRLLKNWRLGDGPLHELAWFPFETTQRFIFGLPPVLLAGDSLYNYRWDHKGSVDILLVFRKSGAFVSRTHFNSRGVEQETPYEKISYAHKKQPVDRPPVSTGHISP